MSQENKDLLLKDLCSRLPYGVKCKDEYAQIEGKLCQIGINYNMCLLLDENGESKWARTSNCKPYLFPLSSMTEEQCEELIKLINTGQNNNNELMRSICRIDFYHKNHFDYRGLIEKGLAFDATNKNIY